MPQVQYLPYMGKPTASQFTAQRKMEAIETIDLEQEFGRDPAELLIRKIEGLAKMLRCTEQEAEHILFGRAEHIKHMLPAIMQKIV